MRGFSPHAAVMNTYGNVWWIWRDFHWCRLSKAETKSARQQQDFHTENSLAADLHFTMATFQFDKSVESVT
jgi:hypothetical protein